MGKKLYSFDDHPEHKERLAEWRDKWIANAMSTKHMDAEERRICTEAVEGMYRAASLTPPPRHRIIFVSSPFVMRFAGGFASWIWYQRANVKKAKSIRAATSDAMSDATLAATDAATRAATDDATRAATRAATDDATRAATDDATRAATDDATDDATLDATSDATRDATRDATLVATSAATRDATSDATLDATDDATRDATRAATLAATRAATSDATLDATSAATSDATLAATLDATDDASDLSRWYTMTGEPLMAVAKLFGNAATLIECAQKAYYMTSGGNQWSGWTSYLSFFRHVAELPIDYSKFDHYEQLALHSGPRLMHKEFCIMSDRPEVLKVDERNRPHCEDGPFCRWRDGSALYAIHGVRVPAWVVLHPEQITVAKVRAEANAEVKRIMIERMGAGKYLAAIKAKVIDKDDGIGVTGSAPRALLRDDTNQLWLVGTDGSTKRVYYMSVPPEAKTCREAHEMICGFDESLILNEG